MKKNIKHIKADHANKTLTMSKTFYNKACTFGTEEYRELRAFMADCEGYTIKQKDSSNKNSHKNLTFKRMEEYIKTQPDSKTRLVEFEAVKRVAKTKGGLYPLTKKWFLATYPDYKENSVSEDETATLTAADAQGLSEIDRKAMEALAAIENTEPAKGAAA